MKMVFEIPDVEGDFERVAREIVLTHGNLELCRAARMANLSADWFSRKWKKVMGLTFREALLAYPMQNAVELLRGGMAIQDVALCLEYEDSKSFSKGFKRQFGLAPSKFLSKPTGRDEKPTAGEVPLQLESR